jgi:hypothetical protein
MESNCYKQWTLLGSACLCLNLLAATASAGSSSSLTTQSSDTEQNIVASGLSYAGPQLGEDAFGLSFGADYILWQLAQEGLEVIESNYSLLGTSAITSQGSTDYPKFKYLSGFKINGRVTLEESEKMDLSLQYIWLQRSTGTNTGPGGDTSVYERLLPLSNWSSSFQSSYNVIDFEMGRLSSLARETLSIRNFWGIRGVINSHTWEISSQSADLTSFIDNISYQNTSGAGVRSGTNLAWQLFANKKYFSGLKLIGMSALSGVYGRTYVDTLSYRTPDGSNDKIWLVNNRTSFNRIIPVVDLSIGLSWEITFEGKKDHNYNIEIRALWDTQSWIGYGKFSTAAPGPITPYNLTVQGFTIGTQIMF